ncbi:hypothetical protein PLUTE_a4135 [Pseudoalteromonas luteoviolacea DSM 6061]|nr:hypothetical protein [Pseudoalteromonas luteoviolacea DSM 6061]
MQFLDLIERSLFSELSCILILWSEQAARKETKNTTANVEK